MQKLFTPETKQSHSQRNEVKHYNWWSSPAHHILVTILFSGDDLMDIGVKSYSIGRKSSRQLQRRGEILRNWPTAENGSP